MGTSFTCGDCLPVQNAAIEEHHNQNENKTLIQQPKNLTYDTKRAMAWAHFLADVWHRYINMTHKCEFLAEDDDMGNVLQHVVIFGGAPRDYILGEEFDDIDMFLNTRELNKIHLSHLRKYHSNDMITQSDSVQCCYWQLYLNKFKNENNYQLNATFFAKILINCAELKNKLSVTNYPIKNNIVYMLQLLDDVEYHGYNLKGQDLDLSDTFKIEMDEALNDVNKPEIVNLDIMKQNGKLYHQKSIRLFKTDKQTYLSQTISADLRADDAKKQESHLNILKTQKENKLLRSMRVVVNENNDGLKDSGLKEISLPIHAVKSRESFASLDLSINILIVFLSDFYYADGSNLNNQYEWDVFGSVDTSYLHDGLADLKNKLLRTPMFDQSYTMKVRYSKKRGSDHFWRVVKFAARYGSDWTIDPQLKQETIKFNHVWLNDERFTNEVYYQTFVNYMIEKYVKTASDHQKRFKVMHELEMHKYVVPYFKKNDGFRNCLLQKMNSFSDEHVSAIRQEMKKYGYIFDEELQEKIGQQQLTNYNEHERQV